MAMSRVTFATFEWISSIGLDVDELVFEDDLRTSNILGVSVKAAIGILNPNPKPNPRAAEPKLYSLP
jgi:hypothetical protein